jgi:hypothetical protein
MEAERMSDKLEGPFSIVFHPGEQGAMAMLFGSPSFDRYEIVDMNGLCVAIYNNAFMANQMCLEYNKAFAPKPKESWEQ